MTFAFLFKNSRIKKNVLNRTLLSFLGGSLETSIMSFYYILLFIMFTYAAWLLANTVYSPGLLFIMLQMLPRYLHILFINLFYCLFCLQMLPRHQYILFIYLFYCILCLQMLPGY